ncbi:MAG: M20/M25/M40 family metallo-hydrolase [Myxococcales bacterium]|nr:M20/M25/M40 family metallo-hydrolase [Myxococcales bacterium]MCB9643963.1 M20/M25/M40 family metallo-hydrolase [Myxococcales bacterium]
MEQSHFEAWLDTHQDRWMQEWKEFLAIPSISADPAYLGECVRCATWLVEHLQKIGFSAETRDTATKPVVFASYDCKEEGAPTVLYYGHYDVQPPDPLEDWESPPFEATLRDGRLYARGAQDNKGQTFYFLKALEALIEQGALRYNVRLLIEGEEETSSRAFAEALPQWKDDLQADVLMVCDTSSLSLASPTITMGLRGSLFVGIRLEGPSYDVHSGSFGGLIRNPAIEMARLLATLHDAKGRIVVDGFLDDVAIPSDEDKELARQAPYAWDDMSVRLGVALDGGEYGLPPAHRVGFRPTIEVNGMQSGYNGVGVKTIIPAYATAKITSRLAAGQDPERALRSLLAHLHKHAPSSMRLNVEAQGIGGRALQLSAHEPWIQHTRKILAPLAKQDVAFAWEGGSIPIVGALAELSNGKPVLVGFGLEEDRIHSPNESFSLEQFRLGFLYATRFLSQVPS